MGDSDIKGLMKSSQKNDDKRESSKNDARKKEEEEFFCSIRNLEMEESVKEQVKSLPRTIHNKNISVGKDNPTIISNHAGANKDYRINENDVYNQVRNSVYETFKTKHGRNYELIKELTENFIISSR